MLTPEGVVPFVGIQTGPTLALSQAEGVGGRGRSSPRPGRAAWERPSACPHRWGLTAEYRLAFVRGQSAFNTTNEFERARLVQRGRQLVRAGRDIPATLGSHPAYWRRDRPSGAARRSPGPLPSKNAPEILRGRGLFLGPTHDGCDESQEPARREPLTMREEAEIISGPNRKMSMAVLRRSRSRNKELSEIRKEVIEARNLVIKTDSLLKNLHAEVKAIGKRHEDLQKRQWHLLGRGVRHLRGAVRGGRGDGELGEDVHATARARAAGEDGGRADLAAGQAARVMRRRRRTPSARRPRSSG